MKRAFYFLLICLFTLSVAANERKKVAVVLGGGGAKGVSHIGVLKVLEEAQIPIDYIVGTSMGSIVGGLYSIGYTASEIDSMVRRQDWPMLLSDRLKRSSLTFPEKENSERYILSLPFGKEKKERVIDGVIKGQNIHSLFSSLTIGYHDSVDFNTFPIPFACVALDLVTGQDYIFREGNLPQAMRASMAIPAVFTPVRLDSAVLIDGGVSNNYPVDVAKSMGAEIVIGVDLGTSDLKLLEGINTSGDIIGQLIALYGYEKYADNRENTDLLFRPDMTPYNSASFSSTAVDSLITRGEQEARRRWDEIIALKEQIYHTDYVDNINNLPGINRPVKPDEYFHINKIIFEGSDPRDEKWLLKISGLKENSSLNLRQLENAMSILMGSNEYSHINYKLSGEQPYNLHLIVQKKSSSSINLGIRFDTEELVALLLNTTFDYRSRARSKFALTGRIGKNSYVRFDYSLERNPMRNLNIAYMFKYLDLDIYHKGHKTYNTSYQHHFAEIAYSDMNWLNFMVKVGLRYEYFNYKNFLFNDYEKTIPVVPEGFISYFGLAHLETFDNRHFPTKGVSLRADYSMYTDNFVGYNGKSPFSSASLFFTSVIRLRSKLSLIPAVYGRVLIGGNLAYPYLNTIGGDIPQKYVPQQLPFAGINHIEVMNNSIGIARLQIRQRIFSRHYVFLTGNYGVHHDDLLEIFKGNHLWGGSIGYAYNSFAGPMNINLGMSNWNKNVQFYLNLGYHF